MKIKGNKILFSLFLLLSLSVMAMIFYFSAQWADSSEQESVSLYDLFLRYTHLNFVSHNAFRKMAHFSEFAALGFCFCGCGYFFSSELHPLISAAACAVYALSDEVHQIFVPGRACRIFDVFVDSCGASFGILIFILITLLIIKINDKRRMFL